MAPQGAEMGKLTRRELYERVWHTPMRTLAKEFQISDVGLKKICDRHEVPTPGVGYWAKVAHGKKVTQTKLPKTKDGEPDLIVIEPEQWHLKGDVDDQWLEEPLPRLPRPASRDARALWSANLR